MKVILFRAFAVLIGLLYVAFMIYFWTTFPIVGAAAVFLNAVLTAVFGVVYLMLAKVFWDIEKPL